MLNEQEFLDENECWAGRRAFLGGRWKVPCPAIAIHVIATPEPDMPVIRLCDDHFNEANEAGLVTNPFMDPDEFKRRIAERKRVRAERRKKKRR